MSEGDGRIPLTIIGGYLGAGKSTWLRHALHIGDFAQAHVLINEAAELPVDHLLLAGAAGLTVLADGCACCDGATRFVAAMRDLCDRNVAAIVLETSGLSDPAQIAAHIANDGVLARRIRVTETIVVADALHAAAQIGAEPLWLRQIEAADRIVLTKVDAAQPPLLARLAATMAVLNPEALVSGSVLGSVVELPDARHADPLPVLPSCGESAPIRRVRLEVGAQAEWAAVSAWLSAVLQAHGNTLVRMKGVVRAPMGRLLLQSVRGTVQPPEILPASVAVTAENSFIVLIGRGLEDDRISRSFALLIT
ncbi:CobW family GTP-binding protein [Paracoccus sp. (in: a-proteobacteria)]|uniref:CobW family GTP-binding protein n=1 Tax=Paracoccus sp. TaxID=267 RepID=UPI00396C57A5